MRLGFYYHVPAMQKDGGLTMPGYQGCFIDSLARECEKVVCILHSINPGEKIELDYRISAPNVEWVNLGLRGSAVGRTLRPGRYTSVFRQGSHDLDLVLLRGPSPLLPALAAAAPVPTALLLVGDYTTGVSDLPQPGWRKELIRLWAHWNKWAQTKAAKGSLTFVNSHMLFEELKNSVPNLVETRTTTLSETAFFTRQDSCLTRPVRLLYVGRMDRSKGLLDMVRTIAALVKGGEDVTLDLVGWPVAGDPVLEELERLAMELGVGERVSYLGARAMGPELFACYRRADIFVIASMASEGFPRTIWEAMANSLPVVATRVGSIADFIEGAAVLVQPGNANSLAEGILSLIRNGELRRSCITRGMALARENTLEIQSRAMVRQMESWLEGKHG